MICTDKVSWTCEKKISQINIQIKRYKYGRCMVEDSTEPNNKQTIGLIDHAALVHDMNAPVQYSQSIAKSFERSGDASII